VSSPHRHRPPLEVRERAMCMCATGGSCSSYAAGHALHLVQARLAAATPSEWIDAIVEAVDIASGETVLRAVADHRRIRVWSATAVDLGAGDPVAVHGRYRVLSAGGRGINVALID
jgi:CubicO group peptidase (beta-lactamase class C family)